MLNPVIVRTMYKAKSQHLLKLLIGTCALALGKRDVGLR